MSRIGKQPIPILDTVTVTVENSDVHVKGPKGELTVSIHPKISVRMENDPKQIFVEVGNPDDRKERALWGLMRQLIANAVLGVTTFFERSLEFVGVGYKVSTTGSEVHMEVGFSHPVDFVLPKGVEAKVEKNILTLFGADKQAVGEAAAQIRRIRPPEPYKGKGIKYTDEVIRRKAGKAATKS
ncbi:MAG: 50S ribosomal protein L6 [bacterium]|nr:50S ribosomal protein L6 [bacterium]